LGGLYGVKSNTNTMRLLFRPCNQLHATITKTR